MAKSGIEQQLKGLEKRKARGRVTGDRHAVRGSRVRLLAVALIPLSVLTFACGGSTPDIETAETSGTSSETSIPTTEPTAQPTATPTRTVAPPTATPQPKEKLTTVESGFTYEASSGSAGFNVSWLVIITNPNVAAAEEVRVKALFYDAGGLLVGSGDASTPVIFGKMTTALGDTFTQTTGEPVRMELRFEDVRFTDRHSVQGGFPTEQVTFLPDRFTSKVQATITNHTSVDLESLTLTCAAKDATGNFLAIGSTFYDLLPTTTTAVADCLLWDEFDTSAVASSQFYVGVSFLTSLALSD